MTPGNLLGARYRLLHQLGQGGFGIVWLAEELPAVAGGAPVGMPPVAIRVFGAGLAAEQEARIQAEIATLARLDHPHILRYRHSFRHEGQICLVLDHLAGGSAADLLKSRDGRLPPAEVAAIAGSVARALAYLHEQQPCSFIHRDVKPQNILLAEVGAMVQPEAVRLADFGLSRALRETIDENSRPATLKYSSPANPPCMVRPWEPGWGLRLSLCPHQPETVGRTSPSAPELVPEIRYSFRVPAHFCSLGPRS